MIFGEHASKRAGKEARKMGMKSILLVTDPGLVALGIPEKLATLLKEVGLSVQIFSDVAANPTDTNVEAGIAMYNEHATDGIVALGGGSAMDTAKAIGLMKTHPLPLAQYDNAKGGMKKITNQLPPLIAIPTTSGTGSEVSSFSIITDTKHKTKLVLGSPNLIPCLALVDPSLTLTLPREVTINTGVDALTHLIEAYVSTIPNPLIDHLALFGLELLGKSLRSVVEHPDDLRSRSDVMLAATTGGLVYTQKFLGINHAMAHALSALYDTAHGLANGLLLPFTMEFNACRNTNLYDLVGAALGGEDGITEVRSLLKDIGMELGLRKYGVDKNDFESLALKAFEDPSHVTNPHKPVTVKDFEALFLKSY